ncbi:MAG TPA: hypothetical protein VF301_10835 [Ginsengibacter sp.]|jgi:hypothetical protein
MPNGITYKRTATGKPISVTINLKKHGSAIEDFLDRLEIDKHRNEPAEPLRKVIARLDKKHGIKRTK